MTDEAGSVFLYLADVVEIETSGLPKWLSGCVWGWDRGVVSGEVIRVTSLLVVSGYCCPLWVLALQKGLVSLGAQEPTRCSQGLHGPGLRVPKGGILTSSNWRDFREPQEAAGIRKADWAGRSECCIWINWVILYFPLPLSGPCLGYWRPLSLSCSMVQVQPFHFMHEDTEVQRGTGIFPYYFTTRGILKKILLGQWHGKCRGPGIGLLGAL